MDVVTKTAQWATEFGTIQRVVLVILIHIVMLGCVILMASILVGALKGDSKKYRPARWLMEKKPIYGMFILVNIVIISCISFIILIVQPFNEANKMEHESEQTVISEVSEIIRANGDSAEFKTENGDYLIYRTRTVAQEFVGGKEPAEVAALLREGDTVKYTYQLNYSGVSPLTGISDKPEGEREKNLVYIELVER